MDNEQSKEAPNEMDVAAAAAAKALDEVLANDMTASGVMVWFKANYLASGHKRLGRILVAKAKELGL